MRGSGSVHADFLGPTGSGTQKQQPSRSDIHQSGGYRNRLDGNFGSHRDLLLDQRAGIPPDGTAPLHHRGQEPEDDFRHRRQCRHAAFLRFRRHRRQPRLRNGRHPCAQLAEAASADPARSDGLDPLFQGDRRCRTDRAGRRLHSGRLPGHGQCVCAANGLCRGGGLFDRTPVHDFLRFGRLSLDGRFRGTERLSGRL